MSTKFIKIEELRAVLDELLPLTTEISELRGKLEEAISFFDMANTKYEVVMDELIQYKAERNEIVTENKILKSAVNMMEEKVKQLTDSCDEMEQYSRRDCIKIKGIPLPAIGKAENTNNIVIELSKRMGVNIDEKNI